MKSFLYIGAWAALSISMSLYNKWVLSYKGFNFPISLGFLHMFGACVVFQAFAIWKKWTADEIWPRPSARPHWPHVVITASLFSLSISLRNSAFAKLPLSYAQLLASLSPIFTYSLSVAFGFTKLRARVLFSLFACVFGVWVGLSGSLQASWHGIVLQASGIFLQTLQAVLLQKLMAAPQIKSGAGGAEEQIILSKAPVSTKAPSLTQPSADRPTPAEMLAVYAPFCATFLFFPACAVELEGVLLEASTRPPSFFFVIAGNVVVALALNLSVATCIHRYTALTLSLSGLAKDWLVVAASNITFGREITLNFVTGMTIVTVAMLFYTFSMQGKKSPGTESARTERTKGEKITTAHA